MAFKIETVKWSCELCGKEHAVKEDAVICCDKNPAIVTGHLWNRLIFSDSRWMLTGLATVVIDDITISLRITSQYGHMNYEDAALQDVLDVRQICRAYEALFKIPRPTLEDIHEVASQEENIRYEN